ncbi:MAG: porphobilinogen synthase [Nitrosopumilus sp.]|nr:porphobilinogen synthase [Nitrosopumilus sp.]
MNIFNNIDNFIFPIFVYEQDLTFQNSLKHRYLNDSKVFIENISGFVQKLVDLNIRNILIFGIPKKRNSLGTSSFSKNGIAQNSVKRIKENFGDKVNIISDVCMCQYNTSGHCGVYYNDMITNNTNLKNLSNLKINNDETLKILGKIALILSESGTDFIAPSSMMDGQVLFLKKILKDNYFDNIKIMSYSSKHNSSLYSPFRSNNFFKSDFIDKSTYQNSFNNPRESVREILLDIKEGADWVMIKPSYWFMDIVKVVKEITDKPLVVQNVSGEYALIQAADEKKWLDKIEWSTLSLMSLKRAGADKIISYFIYELLKKISDR